MTPTSLNDVIAMLDGWIDSAVLMLPNLAVAVLIVLGFWIGARLLSNLTARVLRRTTQFEEINWLLSRLAFVAVMAVGAFVALGVLQLDKTVTSLVAGPAF